jgi:hypothetical protein
MGCCNSKVQPDVEEATKKEEDADSYQDEASTADGHAGQNVFRVLGMGDFTPDGFVPHVDGHALSPEVRERLPQGGTPFAWALPWRNTPTKGIKEPSLAAGFRRSWV